MWARTESRQTGVDSGVLECVPDLAHARVGVAIEVELHGIAHRPSIAGTSGRRAARLSAVPLQISPPADETIAKLRDAIRAALPDADIEVSGGGGHFAIRVVSPVFEGKRTLARQRLIYDAIGPLMNRPHHPKTKASQRHPFANCRLA